MKGDIITAYGFKSRLYQKYICQTSMCDVTASKNSLSFSEATDTVKVHSQSNRLYQNSCTFARALNAIYPGRLIFINVTKSFDQNICFQKS